MNEKEHLSIVLYKCTAKTKWTQTQIDTYFRTQALFFHFGRMRNESKRKKINNSNNKKQNKNEKRKRRDRKGEKKGKKKKQYIYIYI